MAVRRGARSRGPRLTLLIVDVTPQIAELWMGPPAHRQKVIGQRVARYADMMRRGEWLVTGRPLTVRGGRVRNGWHRLHAVTETGLTVRMTVLTDEVESDDEA